MARSFYAAPRAPLVRRTRRISCEAVPPSVLPAGAQGGTSARRSGAALSFVSCIRLFCGLVLLLLKLRKGAVLDVEANSRRTQIGHIEEYPRQTVSRTRHARHVNPLAF